MKTKKEPEHRGEVCYKITLEIQDMLDRIQSLYEFFAEDEFEELDCLERQQLFIQYDAMMSYLVILEARLNEYRNKYLKFLNGPLPYKENEDED